MSNVSDFATHLSTTLPSVTIHPATNKTSVFPSVTFQVRDGMREQFYVGSEGMRSTKFVINIYSKSYAELQTIKDSLITTYHGFSGVIGTTNVSRILVSSYFEDQDLVTEDALFRSILELEILD